MFSIQFESSFIVVVFHLFPFFDTVTTPAVGGTILFKLFAMYIFMTGDALGSDRGEHHPGLGGGIRFVTCAARYTIVRTLQPEGGQIVVKTCCCPTFCIMAFFTVLFRVVSGGKIFLVNIFMAICAFRTYVSELPFRLLGFVKVTGEAGCGYVRACERKRSLLVLSHTEKRIVKAVYIVAFSAIAIPVDLGENRFVIIGMT
jgi:hypothetical protein